MWPCTVIPVLIIHICIISTGIVYWQKQQQHKWQVGVAAPAIQTSTHKSQPPPQIQFTPSLPPSTHTHMNPPTSSQRIPPPQMSVSDVRGCPAGWISQLILSNFCKQMSLKSKLHLTNCQSVDSFQKAESTLHQLCNFYFSAYSQCNLV